MAGINPFSTIQEMPRWEGVPQSFVEWIVRMILRMNTTKASDQANYQSRSRFRACDVPWNNDYEIFPDTEVVADGWERDFETTGTVSDANYGRSKTPYKGTYAQQIKTTGSNGVSLACRPIPVKDETKYTLTAQAKIDNASSAQDGFCARVVWYNTDADFSRAGAASLIDVVSGSANFFTANDTYTAVSGEVSVPAGAKFARIAFYSWTQAGAARTITVDAVTFVQTTIPLSSADGNLDDIDDGATFARVLITALTSGQVDLSQAGVINKTLDYIAETVEKKILARAARDQHFRRIPSHGVNLAPNGGFEDNQDFWNAGFGSSIITDASKAHSGNNYCQLASAAGVGSLNYLADDTGAIRYFPCAPGDVFTFSGYCYLETASTSGHAVIWWYDKDKGLITGGNAAVTTIGSWQYVSFSGTMPANTCYITVFIYALNNSTAHVTRFDDFSLIFKGNSYFAKTTPNEVTGAGRGYSALNVSFNLTTGTTNRTVANLESAVDTGGRAVNLRLSYIYDGNLDNIYDGSTNFSVTANQKTGAGRGYSALNVSFNLTTGTTNRTVAQVEGVVGSDSKAKAMRYGGFDVGLYNYGGLTFFRKSTSYSGIYTIGRADNRLGSTEYVYFWVNTNQFATVEINGTEYGPNTTSGSSLAVSGYSNLNVEVRIKSSGASDEAVGSVGLRVYAGCV